MYDTDKQKQTNVVKAGGNLGVIDGICVAEFLRENTADMLALLPAVRRASDDENCVDRLVRTVYRQLRCAENLQAYATLTVQPPVAQPFCASALASGFIESAKSVCRRADFICTFSPVPIWTAGNVRLFCTVLGNLIGNSLLYACEAPRVTVQLEQRGDNAVLTVTDNGKGLCCGSGCELFLPWRAADPYGDTEGGGLGLGLAIVQRYAAAYGGHLVAEGKWGEGCRMALSMPMCSAGGTAALPAFAADRCSALYVQLCEVCDLPL